MTWENILKTEFEVVEEYDIYDDPKFPASPKLRNKLKEGREEANRRVGRENISRRMIPDMEQVRLRRNTIKDIREAVDDALELVDLYKDIPSVDKMKLKEIKRRLEKIATMLQNSKLIQPF